MGLDVHTERHAELKSARATMGFRFPKVLRIRTLPFKQWVWSSSLQRVTKKADTPSGYLLFYWGSLVTRRMKSNCPGDSWRRGLDRAEQSFFFAKQRKMQTSLQRVTIAKQFVKGVSNGSQLRSNLQTVYKSTLEPLPVFQYTLP